MRFRRTYLMVVLGIFVVMLLGSSSAFAQQKRDIVIILGNDISQLNVSAISSG